jgi:hypothetical protein
MLIADYYYAPCSKYIKLVHSGEYHSVIPIFNFEITEQI